MSGGLKVRGRSGSDFVVSPAAISFYSLAFELLHPEIAAGSGTQR